jgi:hypothetical protein
MDAHQWKLNLARLDEALAGERCAYLPLDPARRHLSLKRTKGSETDAVLAHAVDVLLDLMRVVELAVDGYRRPYLLLRAERMEQLGLMSAQKCMSAWKWRGAWAKDSQQHASEEMVDFLQEVRDALEQFGQSFWAH